MMGFQSKKTGVPYQSSEATLPFQSGYACVDPQNKITTVSTTTTLGWGNQPWGTSPWSTGLVTITVNTIDPSERKDCVSFQSKGE